MTHQRLASLWLVALCASACGGGNGDSSKPYDPDAQPQLADQAPVISEGKPPDSEGKPPDSTELPFDTSTGTSTTSGGHGKCEPVCARLVRQGCDLGSDVKDCSTACTQIRDEPCADDTLAFVDCAVALGYCPDDSGPVASQALVAGCLSQQQALVACSNKK